MNETPTSDHIFVGAAIILSRLIILNEREPPEFAHGLGEARIVGDDGNGSGRGERLMKRRRRNY